jgi:hypothetical protein
MKKRWGGVDGESSLETTSPQLLLMMKGAMMYLDDAKDDFEAVHQAIGAASACWTNLEGAGTFESIQAQQIAGELLDYWIKKPRLGYATTLQLIEELHARVDTADANGELWPAYQTVAVP